MKVYGLDIENETAHLCIDHGLLQLVAYAPGVVRVRYTLAKKFSDHESLMVEAKSNGPRWSVQEGEETISLRTSDLTIVVRKDTGAFAYYDAKANLLVKEPDRGGKRLESIDVFKPVAGRDAEVAIEHTMDGIRTHTNSGTAVVDRTAFHTTLSWQWADDEALYGLGSHDDGVFNLRGTQQYLYQQNTKVAIPILVSSKGYGLLMDTYSLTTFHDDQHGSYVWTDVDDEMDFYFIYGPDFDQIVHHMRWLTGQPPMLPRWMFGYLQSKECYHSQEELLEVARQYRARQIPLDALVQDWKYWPEGKWGQKSFDLERFPEPHRLTQELHEMGVHLMISIWPIMSGGGSDRAEMQQAGYLLANQSTYNAFDAKARSLFWQQAHQGLFRYGVDAWWCDSTEPFGADWRGAIKPEPEARLSQNVAEAKRYLDPEYINAYSLVHAQGLYTGQRAVCQDKRVVNLTRSGYPGQQRYATVVWSGDISAKWDNLFKQIAAGLNFCVTGMPYWTFDVGAFFVRSNPDLWFWDGEFNDGCDDLGYRELYVRWLQLGTFLPILRSHGTDAPREVWRFGEPGSEFHDALVRFIRWRYRMLPYLYSLAGWTTHRGYTMMRMLPFDFREDSRVKNVVDQFMLGPAFLVSPVTRPFYYGPKSSPLPGGVRAREVYLPEGAEWFDFWTGERFTGGQTVSVPAPLNEIPLFVRAGSIVPLANVADHTAAISSDLELRVYPGASRSFLLYEDRGDGYGYEQGQFSTITISWNEEQSWLTLGARKGSYPNMAKRRRISVVLVSDASGRGMEPSDEEKFVIDYDGLEKTITL